VGAQKRSSEEVDGSRRGVNTTSAPALVAFGGRHIECGKTVLVIAQSFFSVSA